MDIQEKLALAEGILLRLKLELAVLEELIPHEHEKHKNGNKFRWYTLVEIESRLQESINSLESYIREFRIRYDPL